MSQEIPKSHRIFDIPVDAIKSYPGNPRIGDVEALKVSLQVNGQYRPIVVRRETREILAGNHTWKAAKALGWETIKATFVDNITDEQAARIVLADNRYSDLATYSVPDLTALLESFPKLENGSYELIGTGYDNYVLTNLEAAYNGSQEPTQPLSSNANDDLRPERTTTCPACNHTWSN